MATRPSEAEVLKALNHPIRRQVISRLSDGVASPKEIAAELGLPIPKVSYHFGILRDLGLVRVVRETPRRGAVERHYAVVARSISVRQFLDWALAADQAKPRGWTAKLVDLDARGIDEVKAAVEAMWKRIEGAQEGSERRRAAHADLRAERYAIGAFVTKTVTAASKVAGS